MRVERDQESTLGSQRGYGFPNYALSVAPILEEGVQLS